MNYVLDQLEELMVSVQHHDIAFIVFTVIALLFLGAILYIICNVHNNRRQIKEIEEMLVNGHNKLAERLLRIENSSTRA